MGFIFGFTRFELSVAIVGNVSYMKSSAENKRQIPNYTQAEFLNFTIYFIFGKSSNLKIWRLSKNAQAFV